MKPRVIAVILGLGLIALVIIAQTKKKLPTLSPVHTPPVPVVIQPSPDPTPAPKPPVAPQPPAEPPPPALVFDAESKEYDAKPGEMNAPFVFSLTNVSKSEVVITNVATSCGCTAAELPEQPWHLAPGTNGEINVTMDLRNKQGRVTKQVTIYTLAHGVRTLLVNVNIPPPPAPTPEEIARGDRTANMELAKSDRQAVFKNDCRTCHVDKGVGKFGQELYAADCGICHDAEHRAAMVPDLRVPKAPRDYDYWVNWITYGRPGSMMPAFGEKDEGPLTKEQIDSLAKYLIENFPKDPAPAPTPVAVPDASAKPGTGR